MRIKERIGRKSLVYVYALTYFLVASIILSLAMTIWVTDSVKRIRNSEYEFNLRKLEQLTGELDSQYKTFQTIGNTIKADSNYRPNVSLKSSYNEISLCADLTKFQSYSALLKEYFLYYIGTDSVYKSSGYKNSLDVYVERVLELGNGERKQEFISKLKASETETVYTTDSNIVFLLPLHMPASVMKTDAVLGIVVSKNELHKRIESAFEQGCIVDVFFHESQIYSGGGENNGNGEWQTAYGEHFTIRGQFQMQDTLTLFRQQDLKVLFWILLVLLIFIPLSVVLARHSIKPIRRLLDRFDKQQNHSDENELKRLENVMVQISNENANSLHKLREQLLLSLLHGRCSKTQIAQLPFLGIGLEHAESNVLVVPCDGISNHEIQELCRSIDGFSDEDTELWSVFMADENVIAVIINFDDSYACTEFKDYISSLNLSSSMSIYAGDKCDTPASIHLSYYQAIDRLNEFKRIRDSLQNDKSDYEFLTEGIVTSILNADEKSLSEKMAKLEESQNVEQMPIAQMRTKQKLILNLATRLKEKDVTPDVDRLAELPLVQDMSKFFELLQEELLKYFDQTEANIGVQSTWAKKVIAYIDKNAIDCDFSTDCLYAEFHIGINRIGKMIKQETGMTFKAYVTAVRMKRAKTLLVMDPDMTITQVAESVGYRKVSNFIKKFSEMTGSTPLQYRKEVSMNE